MPKQRRYTVRATWQSGETKTLGFVREGRAEAYAAHAHRFGAAVTLTDTETGVVLLEMNGPFPVGLAPERPQQRIESFEWGGPMGGVKTDVFAAGASDFAAEWIDTDGNRRLGGFVRFTGSLPGTSIGRSFIRRTAGDYTLNNTSWTNVDTGLDRTVAAAAGNVLMVSMVSQFDTGATACFLDVATVVGGAPVNYFSGGTGAAGDFGITSWSGPSGVTTNIGGPAFYTVQAGDLSGGNVTVRLRFRTAGAVNRVLKAGTSQNFALFFGVVNLG